MEGSGLGLRRTHPRVGRKNNSAFLVFQTRGAETRRRLSPRQRFSLPNFPNTRGRNVKKAIGAVPVVFGVFLTPGAAVAGLHESPWPGCCPLRSASIFAHDRCVTTRVTAGVNGFAPVFFVYRVPVRHRSYVVPSYRARPHGTASMILRVASMSQSRVVPPTPAEIEEVESQHLSRKRRLS